MYEVICLDLDGTLLNDDKKISRFNLETLSILANNNINIIIATGRGLSKTVELTKDFNFPYIIIANNGAIAKKSFRDKIIFCNPIEYNSYKEILEIGDRFNMVPYLHIYDDHNNKSLIIPDNISKAEHLGSVKNIDEIIYKRDVQYNELENILSVVFIDEEEKISELDKEILNLKLKISSHTLSSSINNSILVEYLNPLAVKSIGISSYLNYMNIPWKNVIAFGDDNNDIDMIKKAGIGVCMKNGSDLLKINANHISDYSNNEDGVGRELVKIFRRFFNE